MLSLMKARSSSDADQLWIDGGGLVKSIDEISAFSHSDSTYFGVGFLVDLTGLDGFSGIFKIFGQSASLYIFSVISGPFLFFFCSISDGLNPVKG